MQELVHLRSRHAKKFDLGADPDGRPRRRAVIGAGPQHYQDDQGVWRDIDNRITEDASKRNNPYVRLSADLMLRFPRSLAGVMVVHDRHGQSVAYKAIGANSVLATVSGNVVRYEGAWAGTTLEYHASPAGLKTLLIRDPATAPTQYQFRVTGSVAVEPNGRGFRLGSLIIPPPWAKNNAGEHVPVNLSLTDDVVVVTCDQQAVVVDPSTTLQPSSQDTYVRSDRADTPHDEIQMFVGTTAGRVYRSLVQFDLTGVAVSAVDNATLELYQYTTGAEEAVNVYQVTGAWDEASATWNNQPSYTAVDATSMILSTTQEQWVTSDVAAIVTNWLVHGAENYGFIIIHSDEAAGTIVGFYTSNHAATDPATTPKLVINYTPEPPPDPPTVNPVYDYATTVSGTAEAASTVRVKLEDGTVLGSAVADADGVYSVAILGQSAGTVLYLTAANDAGESAPTTTTVLDSSGSPITTWGDSLILNVQHYSRPAAAINVSEHPLVPDPTANSATPQSVVMGSGRRRKRRIVKGWATIADFSRIEEDYYNVTPRYLRVPEGDRFVAIIERLDAVDMRMGVTDRVWYEAVFMEW